MSPFELVVHHRYASAGLADLSGHGNHGHATDAGPAGPEGARFDGRRSRVVVYPSTSLADLGGLRIRVRLLVDELGDRRTIIEGYLAFSFSVEPDGSLAGSIYTGMEWHGLRTVAGAVAPHQWVDVGFVYDGRDTAMLTVDGQVAATRQANLGLVGSIEWPYGLNIGAWPDEDARVFSGRMAELWMWRLRR